MTNNADKFNNTKALKAAMCLVIVEEIDQYVLRNDITTTKLSEAILGNSNAYGSLKRGTLGNSSMQQLRTFMNNNPNADGVIKKRVWMTSEQRAQRRKEYQSEYSRTRRRCTIGASSAQEKIDISQYKYLDRDPCFKCGARGDIGCIHNPKYDQQASQ